MARRVIEELLDDLEPEYAADETVQFGLDGVTYEIDLASDNSARLRELLAPYIHAGRRVGGGGGGRKSRRNAPAPRPAKDDGQPDPKAVRAWAEEQGIEVKGRGRVPASLVAQFQEAHG